MKCRHNEQRKSSGIEWLARIRFAYLAKKEKRVAVGSQPDPPRHREPQKSPLFSVKAAARYLPLASSAEEAETPAWLLASGTTGLGSSSTVTICCGWIGTAPSTSVFSATGMSVRSVDGIFLVGETTICGCDAELCTLARVLLSTTRCDSVLLGPGKCCGCCFVSVAVDLSIEDVCDWYGCTGCLEPDKITRVKYSGSRVVVTSLLNFPFIWCYRQACSAFQTLFARNDRRLFSNISTPSFRLLAINNAKNVQFLGQKKLSFFKRLAAVERREVTSHQ